MSVTLHSIVLETQYFRVNGFVFIPESTDVKSEWAMFTHGYTSHKGDCLNWASRLSENGVVCGIFDLPGHYLGSFNEVSFEDFKTHSHQLFSKLFEKMKTLSSQTPKSLIFAGHSLGGLLCLRALELEEFKDFDKIAIGIGLGIGQHQATHLFETSFYEKTLNIRRQLVSSELDPKNVFHWIKSEKENLTISGHRVHLLCGEDDVVVGKGGVEALKDVLEKNQNTVTIEMPKRLPHHEPGLATPHLYHFLKSHFNWN